MPDLDLEVVVPPPIEIELVVQQGLAGPPGAPGGGGGTTKLSNGPISGGMVVRHADSSHVAPASCNDLSHVNTIAGVALTATSAAEQELQVVRLGEVTESGWTWTPGAPLYLSPSGVLTQTYSAAWAFVLIVGAAVTATRIVVDFRDPIIQG